MIFGDVRIFESHPLDIIQIDAVIVLQDAANPRRCGHRIGANPDAPAREIAGRNPAAFGIVDKEWVRHAANDNCGQEHERFAIGLGLQECNYSQFRGVVFQVTHDVFERCVRHFHVDKVEDDRWRADFASLQRQGVGVVAQQRAQPQGR
jgi:hypothetical protein